MPKFRRKPLVVFAEQWFPDREIEGVEKYYFTPGPFARLFQWIVETPGGFQEVNPGDWIITGVAGERCCCKPHVFEATYELVDKSGAVHRARLQNMRQECGDG